MVIIVIIHDGNGTSSLTVDRILVNGIHIPFRLVLPIMKVKEIWILIRITKENFQKENRWEGLGFPLRAKTVGVWSLRSGFVDVARKNLANCSPTRAADRCITDTAAIHGIRYTKKKKQSLPWLLLARAGARVRMRVAKGLSSHYDPDNKYNTGN